MADSQYLKDFMREYNLKSITELTKKLSEYQFYERYLKDIDFSEVLKNKRTLPTDSKNVLDSSDDMNLVNIKRELLRILIDIGLTDEEMSEDAKEELENFKDYLRSKYK